MKTRIIQQPLLPPGYTQLEYLQSSGTQYIDLGFKPNQTTKAICKFNYQAKLETQPYTLVFGSRQLYRTKQFNAWDYSDDQAVSGIRIDYANGDNCYSVHMGGTTGILTLDQDYTFELGHAYFKCPELNIDHYQFPDITAYQQDFECPNNLYLFCTDNSGTAQWFTNSRIKSFYAEHNGAPIRNLIPAKNSENVYGMYDTVSQTFFTNAGTGTFTAGPAVVSSKLRLIAKHKHKSILPSEYTQLEYIESSGTQYIDTGVTGTVDTSYELIYSQTSIGNIFGYRDAAASNNITYWTGNPTIFYVDFNNSDYDTYRLQLNNVPKYFNNKLKVECSRELRKITNLDTSTVIGQNTVLNSDNISTDNLYLLNMNGNQYIPDLPSAKVYSCKISSGLTLQRNFIPAKNSLDEIGMYDTVSNTFFGNDGTGTFTPGPEIFTAAYSVIETN